MKFTPIDDNPDAPQTPLPAGRYPFVVHAAKDQTSKSGNEMIQLTLKVSGDGRVVYVFDYLLEKMKFKLVHFARGAGLSEKYQAGELMAVDCMARTGEVELEIEEQNGYPPKNVAKDYIAPKPAPVGMGANAPASVKKQAAPAPQRQAVAAMPAGEEDPPF